MWVDARCGENTASAEAQVRMQSLHEWVNHGGSRTAPEYVRAKERVLHQLLQDVEDDEFELREFLRWQGVSTEVIKGSATSFGENVKRTYVKQRGRDPKKHWISHPTCPHGPNIEVCVYSRGEDQG